MGSPKKFNSMGSSPYDQQQVMPSFGQYVRGPAKKSTLFVSPFTKASVLMTGLPNVDLSNGANSAFGSPSRQLSPMKKVEENKTDISVFCKLDCEYFGSETKNAWRVTLKFDFKKGKGVDNYCARYLFKQI